MPGLADIKDRVALITFDCYGTLIDWEAGLGDALRAISGFDDERTRELVEAYIRAEASIEQQSYRSYRQVQSASLKALARAFHFHLPHDQAEALSESLPTWPPFPDTNDALGRLQARYRLGILSNIDGDLLAASAKRLDVTFDLTVTAQDVHAYKPAHPHFIRMLNQVDRDRDRVLHVAQSLYHDARPAAQLGINFVWINRYGQARPTDIPLLAELATVAALADALGV